MRSKETAILIIKILGGFLMLGLAGTIFLVVREAAPESVALVAGMTGTALGGITGLLAKTEQGDEVTVKNPPDQPVPVDEVK